jgi:hypothetical protein
MKGRIVLWMVLFVMVSGIFVSLPVHGSQVQEVSQVVISLDSPYSASLNVSYVQQVDEYSGRLMYTSFVTEHSLSHSSVVLDNPFLPINITVKGLFGARATKFFVNEGGSRFGLVSYYGSSYSYLLVKNMTVYDGSALYITVATNGTFVGVHKNLDVSFFPAPFPGEVLDINDTLGAVSGAISSEEFLSLPYGDVVSYSVSYPSHGMYRAVTSSFDYQATGNVVGSNSINMTENSSLLVKPVFNGQYSFVSFVFVKYIVIMKFYESVKYGTNSWMNDSTSVSRNMTQNNVAGGPGLGGGPTTYPVLSYISIYLPSVVSSGNFTYNITDFTNGTTWHRGWGYFNETINGSFGFMIIPYVELQGGPNGSANSMVRYVIEITGGIVGVFSVIILTMLAVGFMAGGTEAVADTYEKLKGLVVMDGLFFMVFISGIVFQILGAK